MKIRFRRFFSTDSAKAIKADKFGHLNGINYAAQSDIAGVGNMCSDSTPGCRGLCLGEHAGRAAISKPGEVSPVMQSRIRKTRFFMSDPQAYLNEACHHIERLERRAEVLDKLLCVRMNGSTDTPYERLKIQARNRTSIYEVFKHIQFVEYTKRYERLGNVPDNVHLTFSRSELNELHCREALARNFNVAVIFAGTFPTHYLGYPVIDGRLHDLRHLDPKPVIVGLEPLGQPAKNDTTGMVVRDAFMHTQS